MYYFIPAWYGSERIWHSTTTPWYWSKDMIEFDETIHQIRVFQEAGVERRLVLPHYCHNCVTTSIGKIYWKQTICRFLITFRGFPLAKR